MFLPGGPRLRNRKRRRYWAPFSSPLSFRAYAQQPQGQQSPEQPGHSQLSRTAPPGQKACPHRLSNVTPHDQTGQRPSLLARMPLTRSHLIQPCARLPQRLGDMHRCAIEVEQGGQLSRQAIGRSALSCHDRGKGNRFLVQVWSRPADQVEDIMRHDVKRRLGQVNQLVVIVHTVLNARGDVRAEIRDAQRTGRDGVHSLMPVVNRVRNGQGPA